MIQQPIFVPFVALFLSIKIVLRKIVFRSLILAFLTRHNLRVYAPIALKFALHICLIVKINW